MRTFPLLRVKRSNEHLLSEVFIIVALYHLPLWVEAPLGILRFLLLVAVGSLIDFLFSLVRYKRLWCCASGVVTAAIISLLTEGIPLWGQLLGVVVALLIGKHLWGGTGKNVLNPAIVGLLPLMLIFHRSLPVFERSLWYLPAVLLGLLLARVRPFAALGLMIGMLAGLHINQELTLWSIHAYGVLFWGSIIITDPVTVTRNKVAGAAAGFLAGFGGILFEEVPIALLLGILLVNLYSTVIETTAERSRDGQRARICIPKAVHAGNYDQKLIDLVEAVEPEPINESESAKLSKEAILRRVKESGIYGMGGAAFATGRKLQALLTSKKEKYLIINAVECDPGLIHDSWLLHHYSEEIRKGIDLVAKCTDFKGIYLAAKDIEGLSCPDYITLCQVKDRYPMGAERILAKEILGRKIITEQNLSMQGILVLNVQTVYAIYRAIYLGESADTRMITVAELDGGRAEVVRVRLGMKLQEVIEAVYPGAVNLFVGGGMMQAKLAEEGAIVDQRVNFIAAGQYPNYKESPQCSKCGKCIKSCPNGLRVNLIADLVDQGRSEETDKYYVNDCISCGSCSYSCPAGRNLMARVQIAKNSV